MTTILKTRTLLAAAVLALGAAAIAQTPPAAGARGGETHMAHRGGDRMGGDPARMQERIQRMQERMARRMAQFKQKLQITSAQEGAWTSWQQAVTAAPSRQVQRPSREEMEKMTTPQRIDRMRALRAERMAAHDRRADATKVFYGALTAEQQKVFDAETARMRGGRHGGHRGGGRHHG
jgi:protein CpxP